MFWFLKLLKIKKKKVVIVGGGFAGVVLIKEIFGRSPGRFSVTLVDKNDYQLFKPALYAAVSTRTEPSAVFSALAIKFADIFKGQSVEIIKSEPKEIVFDKDKLILKGNKEIDYDYLVLAAGTKPDLKSIPGAERHAITLLAFEDALKIKTRAEEAIRNAPKRENIDVIILGAGFSGCELAAELIGQLKQWAEVYGHPKDTARIRLVEGAETILPLATPWLQRHAEKKLKELGIEIFVKSLVKEVKENAVVLENGETMRYDVLIWAIGPKLATFACDVNLSSNLTLKSGRRNNVFVVGDMVSCDDFLSLEAGGASARSAIHQAEYVAYALSRLNTIFAPLFFWTKRMKIRPYKTLKKPLYIMNLGIDYGLADLGLIKIKGRWALALKNFIFLNYFCRILPWRKAFETYRRYLWL